MADDLINALQTANRSASVLQGIANPPQINPLAAINAEIRRQSRVSKPIRRRCKPARCVRR